MMEMQLSTPHNDRSRKDKVIDLHFNKGLELWQIVERLGMRKGTVNQILVDERRRRREAGYADNRNG